MNIFRKIYIWFGSNPGSLLIHISLLLVAAGAVATWIGREEGSLRSLPGQLTLLDFTIDYYPGGTVPLGYTSKLSVNGKEVRIAMNDIHIWEGYRLMQSGYDSEGCSIIAISRDLVGIPLVYSGFILFAAGGLLCMLRRHGRFRTLLRGSFPLLLIIFCYATDVRGETIYCPRAACRSSTCL